MLSEKKESLISDNARLRVNLEKSFIENRQLKLALEQESQAALDRAIRNLLQDQVQSELQAQCHTVSFYDSAPVSKSASSYEGSYCSTISMFASTGKSASNQHH